MPKSTGFNETVSLDLKNVSSVIENPRDKRFILYLTDEFAKMIRGRVIPNKEGATVTEAILCEWDLRFCGLPKKSFHADNGLEFANSDLRAACNKAVEATNGDTLLLI